MSAAAQHSPVRGAARLLAWPALVAAALVGTPAAAQAQPMRDDVKHLSIETLKRDYLACHRASMRRALDSGEAMHCSVIYEALKHRAFGGDFERVLAWTRAQDARAAAAPASRPDPPNAASCTIQDL